MATRDDADALTPLQRTIYEVDQLGLNLRDSMRLVTQRIGFFVGQQRYLEERKRIQAYLEAHGDVDLEESEPTAEPNEATHQIGSA